MRSFRYPKWKSREYDMQRHTKSEPAHWKKAEDRLWELLALIALIVALSNIARAQTPSSGSKPLCRQTDGTLYICSEDVVAVPTPPPAAPAQDDYVFVGITGTASTSPHPSPLGVMAVPIGAQSWSWTMQQILVSRPLGKIAFTPVTSTGVAKEMYKIPMGRATAHVIILGTLGVGSATSGESLASNVGAGLAVTGLFKRFPWAVPFVGVLRTQSGSVTQWNPIIAIGRSWGK